jgi:adenylate kinase
LNIIFIGAPGAGKGTQAFRVAQKLKLAHIATGDLFRQAMEKNTEQARRAKPYIESGKLVPDEITIQIVLERISAPDCSEGVIFDGFPRNLKQAEALDKALSSLHSAIDLVIYIKVDEQILIERLSGRWICRKCQAPYHAVNSPPKVAGICDRCGGELYQRADDTIETIKKRLVVYQTETTPLIQYYSKMNKLREVNGVGSEEEIETRIIESLRQGSTRVRRR